MGQYFKKMKADARGYFFNYCLKIAYRVNRSYYSSVMPVLLFMKGIKTGKSLVFFNKPYFFRYPESAINIGSRCEFISSRFYNLIGVNNCCIISTLAAKAQLHIGNSTGFSGVRLSCWKSITIGNDCLIGANVLITDSDWHPLDPAKRKEYGHVPSVKIQPVKIGNNVFIGANSIILKGTEIGDNSVIGAGSVVFGIIPPNVIAAGNPCKIIKALSD
jgi:acetyltransferase-like isoleucine patch superfamily enzyme